MLTNITTQNGTNKPTPQVVLVILSILIPTIWIMKGAIVTLLHIPPQYSTEAASILSYALIHLANQFGVDLPGSSSTVTISQPKPGEAPTATVETKNVTEAVVNVTPTPDVVPDAVPAPPPLPPGRLIKEGQQPPPPPPPSRPRNI